MTARLPLLSLSRPLAHLRELAGGVDAAGLPLLSQAEAGDLLGLARTGPGGWSCSTLASREQRGGTVQLRHLVAAAEAYGLQLEIRVRAKAKA